MKNYFKRYLILAIAGAIIIGLAFYLLLNNYLDREKILVAAQDIKAGTRITVDDLGYMEFYKNSLPTDYLLSEEGIIGNTISIERRKGDYISIDMFDKKAESSDLFSSLENGDVIIAVEIQHPEPILKKLKNGDIVSIVSTIRDKDFLQENFQSGLINNENDNIAELDITSYKDHSFSSYIEMNTFPLSKNIVSIDGQIIIRNLKIVNLQKDTGESNKSLLINNEADSMEIYFRCSLEEAPMIARLTADSKYKIIYEKL